MNTLLGLRPCSEIAVSGHQFAAKRVPDVALSFSFSSSHAEHIVGFSPPNGCVHTVPATHGMHAAGSTSGRLRPEDCCRVGGLDGRYGVIRFAEGLDRDGPPGADKAKQWRERKHAE